MSDEREFWAQQFSSLHRSGDDDFYREKAREHAAVMDPVDLEASAIDLGCGAGELLLQMLEHANIRKGLDRSERMLGEAKRRLSGKAVDLFNEPFHSLLPTLDDRVWMSTGALNQYLSLSETGDFLDMFRDNAHARSLYLFDCVDPLRFSLWPYGLSYVAERETAPSRKSIARVLYLVARRVQIGALFALGLHPRPFQSLRRRGMGYGALPLFWLEAAKRRGFQVKIVSSKLYEYRYHVRFQKLLT